MDEAQKLHPELSLKCGECGHAWKARAAVYCLRCGSKTLFEQQPYTPKEPA